MVERRPAEDDDSCLEREAEITFPCYFIFIGFNGGPMEREAFTNEPQNHVKAGQLRLDIVAG